mmetsp:Transcript_89138/g.237924  ORF Transcript_89138/g.237924 Transcript_89138/m.237924 type:complete len:305 (-) Transcript_89138:494-1408(-)
MTPHAAHRHQPRQPLLRRLRRPRYLHHPRRLGEKHQARGRCRLHLRPRRPLGGADGGVGAVGEEHCEEAAGGVRVLLRQGAVNGYGDGRRDDARHQPLLVLRPKVEQVGERPRLLHRLLHPSLHLRHGVGVHAAEQRPLPFVGRGALSRQLHELLRQLAQVRRRGDAGGIGPDGLDDLGTQRATPVVIVPFLATLVEVEQGLVHLCVGPSADHVGLQITSALGGQEDFSDVVVGRVELGAQFAVKAAQCVLLVRAVLGRKVGEHKLGDSVGVFLERLASALMGRKLAGIRHQRAACAFAVVLVK